MIDNKIVLGQLVYIIPSIILYVIEIYVMFIGIHKPKFNKSSFNRIFLVYAVNNIIASILYYFFFRMGPATVFSGLFEQITGFNIVLALFWQLLYHTSLTTNLLDLILSMNRFTAMLAPARYQALWDRKTKWVVAFVIVFPYVCFWYIPFREPTMAYDNITNAYSMVLMKPLPITWPSSSNILGTCVTLRKRRHMVADSTYQQEKVYFFFMLCVFVNQLLSCSTQWMLSYVSQNVADFIHTYQFIIADLGGWLPAWALFLTSFTLRKVVYDTWMLSYVSQNVADFIHTYQFIIADLGGWLPSWALFLTSSTLRKVAYETIITNKKENTKMNIAAPGVEAGIPQVF
ncbi:hypothetical protein FO519_003994 [Halicephalobus sp. NKZ332]|nr:hypothetical protein FO519_003994 [Halicephalobus sp. NKZ332]